MEFNVRINLFGRHFVVSKRYEKGSPMYLGIPTDVLDMYDDAGKKALMRAIDAVGGETPGITLREFRQLAKLSKARVSVLAAQGRIPGAVKLGRDWVIDVSSGDIMITAP